MQRMAAHASLIVGTRGQANLHVGEGGTLANKPAWASFGAFLLVQRLRVRGRQMVFTKLGTWSLCGVVPTGAGGAWARVMWYGDGGEMADALT